MTDSVERLSQGIIVTEHIADVIRKTIVEALNLPVTPQSIDENAPLFGPEAVGGLALESLSSLEILAALSDKFQSPLDDIEASDFYSVTSLADYLRRQIEEKRATIPSVEAS
jgi:acyl carrier protein